MVWRLEGCLFQLIYENQLAELRFSRFFLARLLRPTNEVDVHHLAYYDPVLYKYVCEIFIVEWTLGLTDLNLGT